MKIYQVDSFTDKIFKGNPAGVCILRAPADEIWMQNVAAEMNVSETAFLYKNGEGYNLRWFTPRIEVDLCGHATLASAHVLWETGVIGNGSMIEFYTKSGTLIAQKSEKYITIDFPAEIDYPAAMPRELEESLGVNVLYSGYNRTDYIIEVENEETVRALKPNLELMKKGTTRGVIVTSKSSNPQFDFVSRFFAPAIGIPEDPVTGSAHCCLGPYWKKKLGKPKLMAYQASERGGELLVEVGEDRVLISGRAVTVFCAEFKEV